MKKKKLSFKPLGTLWACLVYLFLYLPVIVVMVYSFNDSARGGRELKGFTFAWYGKMFENREMMTAFGNTLIVGISATVISVILGTLCAVGLHKLEFKLKSLVSNALYIPIVIPEIVFGIALLMFFSMLKIPSGFFTLIVSHITFSLPFVVITVRSRLAGFDHSLIEAAQDLGASSWRTFWRVTFPLIVPGIISGGLLALTLSFDDVVITTFTAGPNSELLPIYIQEQVRRGIAPDVNALSTLMVLGVFLILILSNLVSSKMDKGKIEKEGKKKRI